MRAWSAAELWKSTTGETDVSAAGSTRPIAIHPADAAYARQQGAVLDEELHAGQRLGPLAVVGVPGKSPREVAFHCPQRRILIVGDGTRHLMTAS